MTVERAKMFGWVVVGGNGTLKKSALAEVLETLLTEIERLESVKNTEQQVNVRSKRNG
jgi:hypothetical protein